MKKRDQRKFNVYERSAGPDHHGELPTRGTDHELHRLYRERLGGRRADQRPSEVHLERGGAADREAETRGETPSQA